MWERLGASLFVALFFYLIRIPIELWIETKYKKWTQFWFIQREFNYETVSEVFENAVNIKLNGWEKNFCEKAFNRRWNMWGDFLIVQFWGHFHYFFDTFITNLTQLFVFSLVMIR